MQTVKKHVNILSRNISNFKQGDTNIRGEHYYSKEYNSTTEFQKFPAEVYIKPNEENNVGLEKASTGAEVTTVQKDKDKSKKRHQSSSLIEKLFNSLKGVATTATVATVALVGGMAITSSTPKVELVNFEVVNTSVQYEMLIDDIDYDKEYSIVISTTNEDDITFSVFDNGLYENVVEGLKPEWEYSLAFVGFDEYLGKTIIFEKIFQTYKEPNVPPEVPNYQLNVTGVSLVGIDEAEVYFNFDNLDETCSEIYFELEYSSDVEKDLIYLRESDFIKGYVTVYINGDYNSFALTPIVKYEDGQKQKKFATYNHTFENVLDTDVFVNTQTGDIFFYLKSLSNGASRVVVEDVITGEIVYEDKLYFQPTDSYNENSPSTLSYKLYLINDDGLKVSNDCYVTVDTTFTLNSDFVFNYKKTGDVGITYNNDDTVNVYIQTDFSSDNEELYYQVTLGERRFKSREKIFEAIGIYNDMCSLIYDVCIDVNGVQYSIYNVCPSGAINEINPNMIIEYDISENGVGIYFDSYYLDCIDLDSLQIVSSGGEEIFVLETDWVFNEDTYLYSYTTTLQNEFEHINLYATFIPYANQMEGINEYKGSIEYNFYTILEK